MQSGIDFSKQEHGGAAAWGYGDDPELLDLSVNVNPFGPPEELLQSLQSVKWWQYPDPAASSLRLALSELRGIPTAKIALGNGANELLWAAARAFLREGSVFTCLEPCYSEFSRAARQVLARPAPYLLEPQNYTCGLEPSIDELLAFMRREGTKLLYLCNPNSPTGAYLQPDWIRALCSRMPELLIVLDESFLSLSEQHERSAESYPDSVLRVVSLTKDFALAGLRLGYAFGAVNRIERLQAEIPNWSVNSFAQAAGLWCLQHSDFLLQSRENLLAERQLWEAELAARGLRFLASSTIFLMLQPPEPGASALAEAFLRRHRILVRGCSSYGWPDWWRIAIRGPVERQRFFQALDSESESLCIN